MTTDLRDLLTRREFVTRPQILRLGGDDEMIADRLRRGTMVRLGPGLYAPASYRDLRPENQHLVRARAIWTRFGDRVAFSHHTAALLHGMAVWNVDLDVVHVTRRDGGRSRAHRGVAHHKRQLDPDTITRIAGVDAVAPARAAWDMSTDESVESALVTVDSGLRAGLFTESDLVALCRRHRDWRGARRAKVAFSLADAGADSPGETRTRFAFYRAGIPAPRTQYKVFDRHGRLIAVTDFAWPEFRHIAEFDGFVKYRSTIDLAKEKAREDAVRAAGWGVTRIIWSQLSDELIDATLAELRDAMQRSARTFT